jgi:uncharacterized membrane protein
MANKYDTNPLDPEFPEKAKAAAAEGHNDMPTYSGGETRRFPEVVPTEEQTRRFADPEVAAYGNPYVSTYNGQYVPAQYNPQGFAAMNRSSNRKVDSVGLPENMLIAAPYIPWYIGMVAGLLILFLVPKSENKVRFHAAQGLAAHLGILLVTTILAAVGNVAGVANFGSFLFSLITSILLVVWAIKAWRGKPVHIESVDSLTNWLEEKIAPKS